MADLKNMTGTEAFQLAKDESALTIEEIAERLTVSPSVIKRYLNAGDNYLPSLEMIPRLCSTLGNNILLRWLECFRSGHILQIRNVVFSLKWIQ